MIKLMISDMITLFGITLSFLAVAFLILALLVKLMYGVF